MTETSQIEEMKRYLFYEMTKKDREALEERFFEDSGYFYDLLELENDLIDSYVRNELTGKDLTRFRQSLTKSAERREKVADARTLQVLIAEENQNLVPITAPSFLEKILNFFHLRTLGFKFAAAALAVLLAGGAGFLLYRNWQARQEFAEIEKRREAERIEKENRLKQLEEEQRRIAEERRQNEENKKLPENINGNIAPENNINQAAAEEKRKNEIEKLRREIEDSQQKKNQPPPNLNKKVPSKEYLAVALIPIGRGGNAELPRVIGLKTIEGKQQARIIQSLPKDKDYASFEVVSNGKTIAGGDIAEGTKSIEFRVPVNTEDFEIKATERTPTRGGGNSESLGTYRVKLTKKK